MKMLRKQFFIREDQLNFLRSIPGSTSEHIRLALDFYIEHRRKLAVKIGFSPSQKGETK